MRSTALDIRVIAGRQSGATARLELDTARTDGVRIGSSCGHRLVLLTRPSDAWSLAFRLEGDEVQLDALAGEIALDGAPLGIGESRALGSGADFAVGDIAFRVTRAHSVPASSGGEHDRLLDEPSLPGALRLGPPRARSLAALACVGLGVLLIVLASGSWVMVSPVVAAPAPAQLEQLLESQGFDDVVYEQSQNPDAARLAGRVSTRGEQVRLVDLLARNGIDLTVDVQIADELALAIADVYRVHGIEARVDIEAPGRAHVTTNSAKLDTLAAVEGILRADLESLQTLRTTNTLPRLDSQAEPAPRDDPAKRVQLLVGGERGYILTRDGAKYFIGSVLPTGHRIVGLSNGSAELEKDGEPLVLQF